MTTAPASKLLKVVGIVLFTGALALGLLVYLTLGDLNDRNEPFEHSFRPALKARISHLFAIKPENKLPVYKLSISPPAEEDLEKQIASRLAADDTIIFGSHHFEFVKARKLWQGDESRCEVRIRGDMPGNFNRGLARASMRINVPGLHGPEKNSIISPELEAHNLFGILFYRYMRQIDIIAPEVTFVNLHLGYYPPRIAILQQGFSSSLLKANNREGGILFRYKNDCANRALIEWPQLDAYNGKYIKQDSTLQKKLDRVKKRWKQAIQQQNIDSLVDLSRFATYFATCEFLLGHHSYRCSNAKFWFNPSTELLEPIAWDPANFDNYESTRVGDPNTHNYRFDDVAGDEFNYPIHALLAKSEAFMKLFNAAKEKVKSDGQLANFTRTFESDTKELQALLNLQGTSCDFQAHYVLDQLEQ